MRIICRLIIIIIINNLSIKFLPLYRRLQPTQFFNIHKIITSTISVFLELNF